MIKMNKMMGISLALILVAGSAMAGVTQTKRSSNTLKDTQNELKAAYDQITATVGSLGTLMSAKEGDLRPMLKDFSAQIKRLDSDAARVRSRATKMQAQNKVYFQGWAQEIAAISNTAIKVQSQARLEETFVRYGAIEQGLIQIRNAYGPLMSGMKDLELALNQDLSPAGVAVLQPSYAKPREQAVATQAAIQTTLKAIQVALGGMTPKASGSVVP